MELMAQADIMAGIESPCAMVEEEIKASEEAVVPTDPLILEAETLSQMDPERRLQHDKTMENKKLMRIKELESEIKNLKQKMKKRK